MTSSRTSAKPLSPATRTAARARMRARAAANVASRSSPNEEQIEPAQVGSKAEDVNFHLPSLPQALVAVSSSKNHDGYPQSKTHFGHSIADAIEPQSSPSNTIPAPDSYPHTGFTVNDASKAEGSPLEPDSPLVFRRPPISENARNVKPPVHTRQGADPVMLAVRPRVKLYHELENDGQEDIETRPSDSESDSPYIPGPDAENNLRCLKWLMNVGKSGGYKRS